MPFSSLKLGENFSRPESIASPHWEGRIGLHEEMSQPCVHLPQPKIVLGLPDSEALI
jgi:hypothetical protein